MRNVTIFHIWFGQHVGIILRKTPPKSLRFSPRFFFFKVSKQTLLPLLTHKLSLHEALLVCVRAKSLQLCPTLCDSMSCSPPGYPVHGDSPGENTGVGCMPFSRGFSWPRDLIRVSCVSYTGRWVLYHKHHLGSPGRYCLWEAHSFDAQVLNYGHGAPGKRTLRGPEAGSSGTSVTSGSKLSLDQFSYLDSGWWPLVTSCFINHHTLPMSACVEGLCGLL